MDCSTRLDRKGIESNARLDDERESELVGGDAAVEHDKVEEEGVVGSSVVGATADHDVVCEGGRRLDLIENEGRVVDAVGGGEGDEFGNKDWVICESAADDMCVDLLQVSHAAVAFLEKEKGSMRIEWWSCRALGVGKGVEAAG